MSTQHDADARHAGVAIIAAGVIGCAIAYALARATTLRIVVFERGTPGCEASNAAAGVLAVASGQARQGVLLDLRRRSAAMFPTLARELEEQTAIHLGYRQDGLVSLAFSESEAVALQDLVQHRNGQGLRCQMLTHDEAHALEPVLSPRIHAAALFPDDHSIDNERLVAALAMAARQRGVVFRSHSPVRALSVEGGTVTLHLASRPFEAGLAVVAAGAWSGELLAPLGSKDVSRNLAGHAAQQPGLDAGILKKMLPVIAAVAMGALIARSSSTGFAPDSSSPSVLSRASTTTRN